MPTSFFLVSDLSPKTKKHRLTVKKVRKGCSTCIKYAEFSAADTRRSNLHSESCRLCHVQTHVTPTDNVLQATQCSSLQMDTYLKDNIETIQVFCIEITTRIISSSPAHSPTLARPNYPDSFSNPPKETITAMEQISSASNLNSSDSTTCSIMTPSESTATSNLRRPRSWSRCKSQLLNPMARLNIHSPFHHIRETSHTLRW